MFERLSDNALRVLLERGKTLKGVTPFLRYPKNMIALREEGYRRGIVMVSDERFLREAKVWERL